MLTVEGCLEALNRIADDPIEDSQGNVYKISNTWDRRFTSDVASHAISGNSISTSQSEISLKLIQRYRDHLIAYGIADTVVDSIILTPVYARPPYQSTNLPREVRYAGNNKLVFRCKYNAGVIEDLKKLKGVNHFLPHPHPMFIREHKLWIVDVNSGNWEKAMDAIKRHRFEFDDTVAQYFADVSESIGQLSHIESTDDTLTITIRDDDFLGAWVTGIMNLEG